jgi:hypothetical protein
MRLGRLSVRTVLFIGHALRGGKSRRSSKSHCTFQWETSRLIERLGTSLLLLSWIRTPLSHFKVQEINKPTQRFTGLWSQFHFSVNRENWKGISRRFHWEGTIFRQSADSRRYYGLKGLCLQLFFFLEISPLI